MTGAVFAETLRRNWKAILWWGGGLALLAMTQVLILQDVEALQQMAQLMETLPPALLSMFGGADIEFMATPEGYMSFRFFSFFPIMLGIYAVTAGLNVTANDEEQGILDVVLSLPLARWRIIVEKILAYILLIVAILLVTFVGFWLAVVMTPSVEIRMGRMAEGMVNVLPSVLLILGFTILVSTLVRRRNQAAALAAMFVASSYLIDALGEGTSGSFLDNLRALSFYNYYDSTNVIRSGLIWGNMALLTGVMVLFVAGAVWAFQRRDVGI